MHKYEGGSRMDANIAPKPGTQSWLLFGAGFDTPEEDVTVRANFWVMCSPSTSHLWKDCAARETTAT